VNSFKPPVILISQLISVATPSPTFLITAVMPFPPSIDSMESSGAAGGAIVIICGSDQSLSAS